MDDSLRLFLVAWRTMLQTQMDHVDTYLAAWFRCSACQRLVPRAQADTRLRGVCVVCVECTRAKSVDKRRRVR